MSLILNIDTATETAQVNFARDGIVLQSLQNVSQKDHASFVQVAIQQLLQSAALSLNDVDAIAVTAGPGSYTGLRVGMSSAKGLCYALNKPLIALNTLEVLTVAAIQEINVATSILYCPMIDARRMEVFTALYTQTLTSALQPCAMVLNEDSFTDQLQQNPIVFFGSGAAKWQAVCKHSNASFAVVSNVINAMAHLSDNYFQKQAFANLAYTEPFYLKEFQDKI
ncbi:tRNA (adenosine(37)-N6)-threonylcarbamoyltransferase complex dimerization subunit type 1 TsaB [Ferruginibacter sp. SUN106]|uniref:tRNA (adenosine(37)-N6)-threonylcarbamoyltransferase complex dimerization subunit type 1 TsaB n=1 Tax=Ferruginibacter sp. SUN106 TaxID=2978348 RepID=UPI003D361E86